MRIVIVTDAWSPQVNGVVRTLEQTISGLRAADHEVLVISPDKYRSIPCPTYPEIRLALFAKRKMVEEITAFRPEAIHIATEGPLGFAARSWCLKTRRPFTTAFHTRFAEYIQARFGIPLRASYAVLRWFHKPSKGMMVSTQTLEDELRARGFSNPIKRWTRGVDVDLFHPVEADEKGALAPEIQGPRPWYLYVGRIAVEKNVEDFLGLDAKGTKVVVGGGPQMKSLETLYSEVVFAGVHKGEDLARLYRACDVFVFPSKTDTFGLVLLEALASGLPVAAFPVPGPKDVIGDAPVGVLSDNLNEAMEKALSIDPKVCRAFAEAHSWDISINQFLSNLHPFNWADTARTI